MASSEITQFRRCLNCGEIYSPERSQTEVCSSDCEMRYSRCDTCGRYFPFETGISTHVCSEECSRTYALATEQKEIYVLTEETV